MGSSGRTSMCAEAVSDRNPAAAIPQAASPFRKLRLSVAMG
jgi:hypothetical protein